jgi:hypothetical protein
MQLPDMQTGCPADIAVPCVHNDASVACSSSIAGPREQSGQLAGPVTAAALEVAALVLEPLGLVLHQQQVADRQGTQPPGMSVAAKQLCAELCGDTMQLLQAMLTVCLHQLVVHAGRKEGVSHKPLHSQADSMRQHGAACNSAVS